MDWKSGRSWQDIMLEFLHDRRLTMRYDASAVDRHVEDAEVISIETISNKKKDFLQEMT